MPTPPSSPYKSHGGPRRILRAWRYSLQGLRAAFRHEAAFRQEVALLVVLVPAALFLGRTRGETLLLLATLVLVLVTELLNSAIEAVADAVSVERHELLGRAKDLGSAAVLLAMLLATGTWLSVLADVLWR